MSTEIFGNHLREKYFFLAEGFTNFNHGSYGSVAIPVADSQIQYFYQQESYPDKWFRDSYYKQVENSRKVISELIRSPTVEDVVLVENASSAVNSILRSIGFKKGEKVLHLSTAYGMVIETLSWLKDTIGIETIVIPVQFPVQNENQIVESVRLSCQQNPDVKLCIFSHISSMPSMIEPIDTLIKIAHEYNSLVLIDGAHAPGVLDINLSDLLPDYYLGNCHKWLYAPKGTAFLYVSSLLQSYHNIQPTVISSSGKHDFSGRFAYTGTRDYTAFASLPAAIAFRDVILGGYSRIYNYCHTLAVTGGELCAKIWGTSLLVPGAMSGYMVNVILPCNDETKVSNMQKQLFELYNIYVVTGNVTNNLKNISNSEVLSTSAATMRGGDTDVTATVETIFFVRLSAQVYLEFSDFERLAYLVPILLQ